MRASPNTATPNATQAIVHHYTLKRWDLLQTQIHLLLRNRLLMGFFVILSTFTSYLDLREPEMAARSLVFKIFFVIAFDAVFLTIILGFTLLVLWLMILIRKNRAVLGQHTLEITPTGLVERTEFNETVHRWQGFHKIIVARRYLFLWVTDSMVHTVPRRSFASEESATIFQHEIETHSGRA